MKATGQGRRLLVGACFFAGAVTVSARASADTIFIEAEGHSPIAFDDVRITSPLRVLDDPAASHGRYITVAAGNNSQTTAPAAEGVATYQVFVPTTGTYRLWGRVIAPTTNDDSFWVKMDPGKSGAVTVNWNGIDPGTTFHWAQVKPSGASGPTLFNLTAGTHTLQVAYREDGAKLDVMVLTSDATFNPKSPPTSVPGTDPNNPLAVPTKTGAGASTPSLRLMWSEVPGAKSYTVRHVTFDSMGNRMVSVFKTGLTGHVLTEAASGACYDVLALFPDGSFLEPNPNVDMCLSAVFDYVSFHDITNGSATPPMMFADPQTVGLSVFTKPGTANSLTAAPAHGRWRFDFVVGGTTTLNFWFNVNAPNTSADSFWVRMDSGTWIKWNNTGGCTVVYNSDAGGARSNFTVAGGSHTLEIAYREVGTTGPSLDLNFHATENLKATSTICDD